MYKPANGGGQIADLVFDENHAVRLATVDDVEPMKEVLRKDPLKENTFIKTFFYPEVEWDTVVELVNAKLIYVKDTNQAGDSKPSRGQPAGPMQSTLF